MNEEYSTYCDNERPPGDSPAVFVVFMVVCLWVFLSLVRSA